MPRLKKNFLFKQIMQELLCTPCYSLRVNALLYITLVTKVRSCWEVLGVLQVDANGLRETQKDLQRI